MEALCQLSYSPDGTAEITSRRRFPTPDALRWHAGMPALRGGVTALQVCRNPPRARSAVVQQLLERGVARRAGLFGEAEDALADDVALHLVGAAVDGRRR